MKTATREWADAFVTALVLTMFIEMFVFQLYKIPSSSMTPTLLGTQPGRQAASYYDVNGDSEKDLILFSDATCDIYGWQDNAFRFAGSFRPDPVLRRLWAGAARTRRDWIIVAKFLYWFSPPKRGDIVVFKTPEVIFDPKAPVYVKRVVGLSGERLAFDSAPGEPGHEETMGHLLADGRRVETPSFFRQQLYEFRNLPLQALKSFGDYAQYRVHDSWADLKEVGVPEDSVYVFGDNTVGSLDSRFWGKVPLDRIRGRAVFRLNPTYFPYIKYPGFLK